MKKNNYVVIGEQDSRRVQLFKDAVAARGEDEPRVVSYLELISGSKRLDGLIESGDIVRIESPGKDFEVERALLRLGAVGLERVLSDDDEPFLPRPADALALTQTISVSNGMTIDRNIVRPAGFLTEQELSALSLDRGLILSQSQWYRGWCSILGLISYQLAKSRSHVLMNSPEEIAILFDKAACQVLLERGGVRVPAALGSISSFENLHELMKAHSCQRVFLKPAHGSSASGIVAYQFSKNRHRAVSTVELVPSGSGVKLYNSRKVRTYSSYEEVKTLVDCLCFHNLFVQKWYPKASISQKTFDLRVVVVAGKSRHVVVRESKTPFTNLHLLNGRGQLSVIRDVLGLERYAAALATCEKAARLFPNCLYVGVDVLISSDFKNHAVAEVNAFGDLLPGILCDKVSTYEAELDAVGDFAAKLSGVLHV